MALEPAYLHDRSSIIGNCLPPIRIHEQQIASIRTQGGPDGILYCETCLNVRNNLTFAL